jgi:hypothetical protein
MFSMFAAGWCAAISVDFFKDGEYAAGAAILTLAVTNVLIAFTFVK